MVSRVRSVVNYNNKPKDARDAQQLVICVKNAWKGTINYILPLVVFINGQREIVTQYIALELEIGYSMIII
jgi:hypothetical protein